VIDALCRQYNIDPMRMQELEIVARFVIKVSAMAVYMVSDTAPLSEHDYIRTCVADEQETILIDLVPYVVHETRIDQCLTD
jgi:hypothetical protein